LVNQDFPNGVSTCFKTMTRQRSITRLQHNRYERYIDVVSEPTLQTNLRHKECPQSPLLFILFYHHSGDWAQGCVRARQVLHQLSPIPAPQPSLKATKSLSPGV
jgi:hypothetical protein